MKLVAAILLLLLPSVERLPQTPAIKSQGACSPNIIANKGEVRFVCQASLDAATVRKLNQVLNEVLSKGNQSADVSAKLDEILAFIHQAAPRSLTESQKRDFLKAVGTGDKGAIELLLVATDPESFAFSRQIGDLLKAAGWQLEYRQGIVVNGDPSGVQIIVADPKDQNAGLLQRALKLIGIEALGAHEPQQKVAIVLRIGGKPLTQ